MTVSSQALEDHKLSKTTPKEFGRLLRMRGGNVLAKFGNMGASLLHLAALSGNLGMIPAELLTIENLTTPNNFGETPLHCSLEWSP